MSDIQPQELKRRIEQGEELTILDVRETWEYEEFNIGARLFPLYELPKKIDQLESMKDSEIIVHCQSGKRSNQAKKFLSQHGFSKVRSLNGGLNAYLED
ncbi:rhodanese-like domain-containing protein [Marinoscillum sp.]|uniref:rhodanese-like domain-containing protein n=1 Tax=Marinoscillum sp. TaxID=2024838 RepID=UPI003BAC0CF8